MSYHIEEFVRFLGNNLDGTVRNNVMYFEFGKVRSRRIATSNDIEGAEEFVTRNDGNHQLYININPYKAHAFGKGKDLDVKEVKTLYIDADRIKTPESKNNPATQEEIDDIPLIGMSEAIGAKYPEYYRDFTGNGFRFLIPVENGTPADEAKLIDYMCGLFPKYIDTNVRDPSRITGIPGTINVKKEDIGRPNRQRTPFDHTILRVENQIAAFTEEEIKTYDSEQSNHSDSHEQREYKPVNVDAEVQPLINKYIMNCSKNAPYILDILQSPPVDGAGFTVDGLFACEVLNKIGDAPRVYATIMKAYWGDEYDARVTEKMWYKAVSTGAGPWSKSTIMRLFAKSKQR